MPSQILHVHVLRYLYYIHTWTFTCSTQDTREVYRFSILARTMPRYTVYVCVHGVRFSLNNAINLLLLNYYLNSKCKSLWLWLYMKNKTDFKHLKHLKLAIEVLSTGCTAYTHPNVRTYMYVCMYTMYHHLYWYWHLIAK